MVGEQVLVKSIQGKRGDNIVTLDVNDLPAGIYLYSVEAGTYKTTRKLVVEH
jgi:signal peptidase I